jgi:hypothetical protein
MEVTEAVRRSNVLAEQLAAAINDYQAQTGMIVASVRLTRLMTYGGESRCLVSVDIELPKVMGGEELRKGL